MILTLRYVGNQEKQRHRTLHQNLSGYEGSSIVVAYSKAQTSLKVVHPKRQLYHSYDPHIFELHPLTNKPEIAHDISDGQAKKKGRSCTERHHGGVFSLIQSLPTPVPEVCTRLSHKIT